MIKPTRRHSLFAAGLLALGLLAASPIRAAGSHAGDHDPQIGARGAPGQVDRTIRVELGDNYYAPERIGVHAGETIRFQLRNSGRQMHEFAIGTAAMHHQHQAEMAAMMARSGMGHSDMHGAEDGHHAQMPHEGMAGHHGEKPHGGMAQGDHHAGGNIIMLAPGGIGELIWRFPEAGELEFACNIPGHYQAGMVGKFELDAGHGGAGH